MRRARKPAPAPLATALTTTRILVLTTALSVLSAVVFSAPADLPDSLSALGAILPPFVTENFDELVKAASDTCGALPQKLLFSRVTSLELPLTRLVQYSHDARRSFPVLRAARRLRAPAKLVLYVPGWWNTPGDASSRAIVNALMTKHPSVHLLDTRLSFCRGYVSAVTNVMPLSNLLFDLIKKLHESGHPASSIHLIGFSLGAHVAGLTGKLVKKRLNVTLGQITALDPARPCFASTAYRLDKRDAQFVHVIHSSTGVLGLEEPMGHADVYVNGVQAKHPECQHRSISLECDHAQAWRLYAASALNEKAMTGRQCASWDELLRNECSGNETVLGYSCSTSAQGLFLYKSEQKPKTRSHDLEVFNPFDLLRWPLEYWNSFYS